ncbi:hypothetical protein [Rhodovulum strictum]|uniref:Uncharacterized protein n=1 Tax=Rhodovulum strictum TaxID=58314 RepID=A0A844BKB1_9RHOB|nr:hypothetical protein [Rhodovulum strictum]MRH22979.1 hypothetical protein [Rhodovulum strictum]
MSAPLSPHAELRRQCLEWAFQTREFTDKPQDDVLLVAQNYYAFITGGPFWPVLPGWVHLRARAGEPFP